MAIIWITGQSLSGKTTLAQQLATDSTIILDGDELRKVWKAGFSKQARWEHNLKTARLAKMLHDQGVDVIVAMICPYKDLRAKVQEITGCGFIYLKGGVKHKDYPYEHEGDKYYFRK